MDDLVALQKNLHPGVTVHNYPDGYVEVKGHLGEYIASAVRMSDGRLGGVRSFYGPLDLERGLRGLKMAADAYSQASQIQATICA